MEENEKQTNSGSGRSRMKKKSTLAKLKEKKEREFGSNGSFKTEKIEKNGNEISLDHNDETLTSHHQGDQNGHSKTDFYSFSTKYPPPKSKTHELDKPRPKPRNAQKRSSISSDQNSNAEFTEDKKKINGKEKSEKYTFPKTESFDSNIESSEFGTSQRRNNFKGSGQSESIESITSGGFTPKPPVTPRSARSTPRTPRGYITMGKSDKRNDHFVSGDESEGEVRKGKNNFENGESHLLKDKNVFDISDLIVDEMELRPLGRDETSAVIQTKSKENQRLLTRRNSLKANEKDMNNSYNPHAATSSERTAIIKSSHPANSNNCNPVLSASSLRDESPHRTHFKSRRRSGSYSPARALPDKFKPPSSPASSQISSEGGGLGSQSYRVKAAPFSTPTASQTVPVSTQVLFTSNENSRSVSTPPVSARLDPVTPMSHPPPLPKDFTSQSLRTTYKIDPNARPHTSSSHHRLDADKSDSGTASGADKVSQKSFSSGSVLPIITTKEARSRSYLEGSVSSATPSMVGTEELERYFPDRKVNVMVGTWNMNELKDVSTPLDDFILPVKCDYVQDIYAIGTQENNMNKKEWEIRLQETLGPSHVMFHSVTLGALHLIIFVRRDLIWFCSLPEDAAISLRAVTMVKTKGAIGISFTIFGSYFLFINCHLTSDRDNDNSRKKHRMGDYYKVIQEMDFKLIQEMKQSKASTSSKKRVDITALYDCVFWCGDLNFRIERQRHAVEGKVNQITKEEFPNFEALLGGDQLLKYMMEGKIFNGFQEGRINFHPTFKFDVNKDTYDSSNKNRVPSYTDRIMFRSKKKNDITCLHYDAVMELKISDHRPVFGQFEAGIKPGRDSMVYGAGHFDRSVYMEANQRRAANQTTMDKKSRRSSICSLQ